MKNYIILLSLLILVISGCRKDTEQFVVNDENVYTSTLVGIVTDENDNPIGGAQVNFRGTTTTTDEYGVYEITGVKVGDVHNFISITKQGYFDGCRTVRTNKSAEIYNKTQLMSIQVNANFQSSTGGDFTADGVAFSFPANAIVLESTGAPYAGNVAVAVRYIDPIEENSAFQMPGDLSAEAENGGIDLLRSFGMVAVELQSESGEKLQVKEGNTVTMTAEIPTELQSDAPTDIPMWHFNLESGLWEREGTATKQGNKYVAEVSHFSYWNYDDVEESIILSGRLVDEDGNPVSAAHILVSAEGANWGGHGNTNLDGTFSGRVTKGKKLNVSILGMGSLGCRNERVLIAQIGPFTSNTNVGDIVLKTSSTDEKYLKVSGSLVDCDGNAVTRGFIRVFNQSTLVTNGKFNLSIPYCVNRPGQLGYVARDIKNRKEHRESITVDKDEIDLGLITVCTDDIQFIEVKNTDEKIEKIIVGELFLSVGSPDSSQLFGWSQGAQLSLSFDAGTAAEGTFDIAQGRIMITENNGDPDYPKTFATVSAGKITIKKNTAGTRRIGNYTVTLKDPPNGETTFTGRFSIKI